MMPASSEPGASAKAPVGTIVMLVIAAFLYAGMMANLGEIQNPNTDAMGRGLAAGLGFVFMAAEWVAVGTLLLIGGINGRMPNWAATVAAIVFPLSGYAAMRTIDLLDHGGSAHLILVPALIAPIAAAYALWARLPALHRRLPPLPTSLAAWGAITALALASFSGPDS